MKIETQTLTGISGTLEAIEAYGKIKCKVLFNYNDQLLEMVGDWTTRNGVSAIWGIIEIDNRRKNMAFTCPEEDYQKATHQAKKELIDKEANTIKVFISTIGWGDYGCLYWEGDGRKSDSEIITECRELIEKTDDIDIKPTDQQLKAEIDKARQKKQKKQPEPKPEIYGPGYCFNCKSYCFGDCKNYAPVKTEKHITEELKEIEKEQNYGINDY